MSIYTMEKIVEYLNSEDVINKFKQLISCKIKENLDKAKEDGNLAYELKPNNYGKICSKCKNCNLFEYNCIACRALLKNSDCLYINETHCMFKPCKDCGGKASCKDITGSRTWKDYYDNNITITDKVRITPIKNLGEILGLSE